MMEILELYKFVAGSLLVQEIQFCFDIFLGLSKWSLCNHLCLYYRLFITCLILIFGKGFEEEVSGVAVGLSVAPNMWLLEGML